MVVKEYKVYFIKNKKNNKIYIGQTSQKLISRINRHFYDLKRNLHNNDYLQRSFNKYGISSFEYGLIEDGIFDIDKSYRKKVSRVLSGDRKSYKNIQFMYID